MRFVSIHDKDATEYEKTRLGFLENAKDVCITRAINGDYSLEFTLPKGDPKWALMEIERKLHIDGQTFRIKRIEGLNTSADSLIQDTCRTHIQYIEDMLGTSAVNIFNRIFRDTPYVETLTDSEYTALGLEPVTDAIDFFETSKKTPLGCLNMLMETLNKYKIHSEVYINGNKIGLVRRLGKDRGVVIDPKYNATEIKPTTDTYQLITKLYPYGKDDMPLAGSQQYILSPNYNILGEYEGFCNMDEITDQDELLEAAEWQFDPDNIDRIDVPKYSVEVKYADINAYVEVGDTVTIVDRDNGITSKQRVISTSIYPFEPNRNSFTVGKPPITTKEAFTGMFSASQYLRINKNGAADELKTGALEFMDKNEDVILESDGVTQKIGKYKTGALFVSSNEQYAVAIMEGKIKVGVADSSKVDGWDWTGVFGDGEVTVSRVFTGTLYSDLVQIMSDDGTLSIEGNIIQMFDNAGTLRLNAGYNKNLGRYVFELYNSDGARTAYLDDDGNLTIRGIFKTGEDNEARTVIDGNGIQSYDANGQADGLFANSTLYNGDVHTLTLYEHGKELFKVSRGSLGVHMSLDGDIFLICNGDTVNLLKTMMYNGYEVANKSDIQNLQQQIDSLKNV